MIHSPEGVDRKQEEELLAIHLPFFRALDEVGESPTRATTPLEIGRTGCAELAPIESRSAVDDALQALLIVRRIRLGLGVTHAWGTL